MKKLIALFVALCFAAGGAYAKDHKSTSKHASHSAKSSHAKHGKSSATHKKSNKKSGHKKSSKQHHQA